MEPIIELNLKSLTFPPAENAVLHDIHFTVTEGEFVAVAGKPASGKSMFLHTLTGAAAKFYEGNLDGTVTICGRDQKEIPLPQVCEFIGFMFQEPQNQIVSVTAENEVAFGVANLELSREEITSRVEEALSYVGLSGMEQRKTTSLSGGQAQRLVLAGILALKTPVLILDQPAAELDLAGKRELYRHIRRLNREKGVTVIMVMDNGMKIEEYADRVIELEEGTVIRELPASAYAVEKETVSVPAFQVKEDALVAVEDVSYRYKGGICGCENISFDVRRGDFLGIMGKNGSGKTTLLKLMEGLLLPKKGRVTVFGETMNKKNAASLRRRIGFLFQNPDFQIFSDTVKGEIAFGLRYSDISEKEKERRVNALLETVGLASYAEEHPQKLSRSQRQKLAFASALVHEPELLIADEPTSGLSEEDSHGLMQLLSDFRVKGGTVILVSHDPELTKTYATTIVVLDHHHLAGRFERDRFGKIPEELLFQGGDGGCD